MVLGYIVCLVLGVVGFLLTAKLGLSIRIAIALAVSLIPAIILTAWIVHIGDKPPSDAITIVPAPNPTPEKGDGTKDPKAPK